MSKKTSFHALMLIALLSTLGACTTPPELKKSEVSSPVVAFIDLDKFDHALAASLGSGLSTVEVPFHERVSPNKIPERMKTWLNRIEKNGGRIQVQEPPVPAG